MDGIDNAIYTMIVIGMCTAYVTVFAFICDMAGRRYYKKVRARRERQEKRRERYKRIAELRQKATYHDYILTERMIWGVLLFQKMSES